MIPPILAAKHPDAPSVFRPENLLREARRQRGLALLPVPPVCLLDPDGDMVRHLRQAGARPHPGWACYHTEMLDFALGGAPAGIVGCAVGAPFAVLVAEQLLASGCRLVVSVTSAGRLSEALPAGALLRPIGRSLRDEGTSYHYAAASAFAHAPASLVAAAAARLGAPLTAWTTDAPYRETEAAIAAAREAGAEIVEMESAALYALAAARGAEILCLAHVTNTMAQSEGDFEKGEADGAVAALAACAAFVTAWREG